jgi:hypothetical protein
MPSPSPLPNPLKNPPDAKVKLGDAVWVKFKLTYRKDLVAKRADRSNYQMIRFRMSCPDGGRTWEGGHPYAPPDVKITTDDQEIEGIYVFDNDPKSPEFIKEGDQWLLEAAYIGESEAFPPKGSRRIHRLGEVQIQIDLPPILA